MTSAVALMNRPVSTTPGMRPDRRVDFAGIPGEQFRGELCVKIGVQVVGQKWRAIGVHPLADARPHRG